MTIAANYWAGKQIFITGAGGFIGSHLVETLVKLGAHVRAFVRYNSRNDPGLLKLLHKDVLANVEIIPGDLRDLTAIQSGMPVLAWNAVVKFLSASSRSARSPTAG